MRPEILDLTLNSSYAHFLHDVYIEKRRNTPTKWSHLSFSEMKKTKGFFVVSEDSARVSDGDEKHKAIPRNHADICKIGSPSDETFLHVKNFLVDAFKGSKAVEKEITLAESPEAEKKTEHSQKKVFWASMTGYLAACVLGYISDNGSLADVGNFLATRWPELILILAIATASSLASALIFFRGWHPVMHLSVSVLLVFLARAAGQ